MIILRNFQLLQKYQKYDLAYSKLLLSDVLSNEKFFLVVLICNLILINERSAYVFLFFGLR